MSTGQSANSGTLDIVIMGREYRVACPPEEREALLAAVAYVDEKMHNIAGGAKNASPERVAVMAALNIAHEHLSLRLPGGGFDVDAIRRRIRNMEAQLDAAAEQQEKLF